MSKNNNTNDEQVEGLRKRIATLEHALAATDVHFTVHDRQGRFLYVNPRGLAAQNLRLEDVEGKSWRELGFPEEAGIPFDKQVEQVFTEEVTVRTETEFPTKDGPRIFENVLQPAYDNTGTVVALVATRQDITNIRAVEEALRKSNAQLQETNRQLKAEIEKRAQIEAALEQLATTDSLTNLHNRRHFFELAEQELARTKRYQLHFSLLLIDLDNFKAVNDNLGHLYGDRVLRVIAKCISQNSRDVDIPGRYGGDEFVILLPETHPPFAQVFSERLCQLARTQLAELEEMKVPVTLSIGIANFSYEADITFDTLLDRADQSLYEAKRAGKDQVVVWQDE
ncbi:MAG TPA: hypothetical protein DCX54_05585 [Flavobacteriales bacterium]|nr:hypothetical protein [Flavobacteriales bacterium]